MIRNTYRRILKYGQHVKKASEIINNYDKLYRMEKYPNISLLKPSLIFLGVTLVGSLSVYWIFQPRIHSHFTTEGSKIAGNIAKSEEVKRSLMEILEDPEILDTATKLTSQLIQKVCEDPTTRQKIIKLLSNLINDQEIQNNLVTLAINFLNRPEIETKLSELVIALLSRQDVTDRINRLVEETCSHEPNREELAKMIKAVLSNEDTKAGLVRLISSLVFGK